MTRYAQITEWLIEAVQLVRKSRSGPVVPDVIDLPADWVEIYQN